MVVEDEVQGCWLCGRLLGKRVHWHHTIPKAKRGRETVPVHPICHRTIHAHFTNAELARTQGARDALLENAQIARFIRWVAGKPPDFHAPTRTK
nr:HNH endonuclease [Altericroceibacterium indicum]